MAIFKFTKNIINNKPIDVYNKGNHYRDFTFVKDIARGIISASFRKDKKNFQIFNIGNGKPVYLKKLIQTLEIILKKKAVKNFLPIQKGDMKSTYANTNKFNTTFVGKFVPLKKGLIEFVNWFRNYYEKQFKKIQNEAMTQKSQIMKNLKSNKITFFYNNKHEKYIFDPISEICKQKKNKFFFF